MKIAIDVDEILANFMDAIIDFHNETFGTSLVKAQFRSFDLNEGWGGTMDEAIAKVHQFHTTHHFANIQPVPGAVDAIQYLKQKHQLHVVTARQTVVTKETHEWLDRYFPGAFASVHLTNSHGLSGIKRLKKDVCQEIHADVFVDDSLENVAQCSELGIPIFMLDYPWNQGSLPKNVHRVFSWTEIVDGIEKLP
jgi:uncharacterized HAD superfamily protein